VIVASLNGNNNGLGLPDAKLIVEGGDRANNCAMTGDYSNEFSKKIDAY
jgi:hypothetical protein